MESSTLPVTAADALKAWDAGETLRVFQIEAKPERQTLVYGAAFELIRTHESAEELGTHKEFCARAGDRISPLEPLSDRERQVAHSIAYTALSHGWSRMVSSGIHQSAPALDIRKEAE